MTDIGQDLLHVPFPQMVQSLGIGVAEAQYALDKMSIRIAQMLAGYEIDNRGNVKKNENLLFKLQENEEGCSLLELGFTPSFYQFSETWIELKIAISMRKESLTQASMSSSVRAPFGLFSASVNASYSQKYQYSAEGSSYFRTKLVTLLAPAVFEQRLKELTKTEKEP